MTEFQSRVILKFLLLVAVAFSSCRFLSNQGDGASGTNSDSSGEEFAFPFRPAYAILVSPENPLPGDTFRIMFTGGKEIMKAQITVSGPSGQMKTLESKSGGEIPCWRVDEFRSDLPGIYKAAILQDDREINTRDFQISSETGEAKRDAVREKRKSWDPGMEELYSAWISALFEGYGEDASWKSLNEVTQDKRNNFLFDHLSLGEDEPSGNSGSHRGRVIMQPDCADNPFFLRAYFAWKLSLPFGFHICDRGYPGKNPSTGTWVTLESSSPGVNRVSSFNLFLRKVMNGVHSGTARTAFDNDHSDYYPVALDRSSLRPGVVYADPYGHTFVLVRWIRQTRREPGVLLAVDAQPDGTIAIKRFWKGNFLFNTREVVGEPGFKAFRPIRMESGVPVLLRNEELNSASGFIPFSLQQKSMAGADFYHAMEKLINPEPMDPEEALSDLIRALHEQLQVRVNSVANGEDFFRSHPGRVISMPSTANGIFQTGGDWENYSTPNRDLRLLIAIDAVLDFPEQVAGFPEDYKISQLSSAEKIQEKLLKSLQDQVSKLTITYIRSDGSSQHLTLADILQRRDAFEMGWNPNDGPEIRWGAPENSAERSTCKRKAPPAQLEKMKSFRKWFQQRLHPPT